MMATNKIRTRVRMVIASLAIGAAVVSLVAPARAAGAQIPVDSRLEAGVCVADPGIWVGDIVGNLHGCLYSDPATWNGKTMPSGVYTETGQEWFVGCLSVDGADVACGRFDTTYVFTTRPSEHFGGGHCIHPIVTGSGTGGFTGATGTIQMKEEPGFAVVRGHVKLGPGSAAGPPPAMARSASMQTSATQLVSPRC